MGNDSIVIRNCDDLDELRACVALQKEVWNFSDVDLVPARLFVVASKVGGQVIGAFQGNDLVGFLLAVPGVRDGYAYLHSHMLGVREDHRNSGMGRRLKLFQREEALSRGIDLVEWTFDPLEIKNAYFNIAGLGAIARHYSANHYGFSSSALQGGLPTDRLVAEWWLNSPRVEAAAQRNAPSPVEPALAIEVPAEIYAWKASETLRSRAQEVQNRNREAFTAAFSKGLAVIGFERDARGNGKFLLGTFSVKRNDKPRGDKP